MYAHDLTALVHLVGFTTGIILYGMLGVMTRRRLAHVVAMNASTPADRIPLVASLLGVVWNVGAMAVFAVRDFGIAYPLPWVAALSYAALGFLPAVVVHAAVRRSRREGYRWCLALAYGTSAIAGGMHLAAAARPGVETPSSIGLVLLTIVYAGLLGILAVTERHRPGFQRSITVVALAAFAVSALHLSRHAGVVDQDSWPMELIGHHASLPLVLAILYQDYRFAFADLFLKRALSLLVLIGLVSLLYATLAAPLVDPHAMGTRRSLNGGSHLFSTGALLTLWIATALAYPVIQRRMYRFVDRVILHRGDYRQLRADLARRVASVGDVDGALETTCALLARSLDAKSAVWRASDSPATTSHPTITLDAQRTEACITIPTALEPSYEIMLAELPGGRSLLSDDVVLIDAVAALVGRRIDEIRLEVERRERERRDETLRQLATEAELRALRAQLNPHFLFNALNTLGHLMQVAPDRALATLYQLTGLLRAVLRRTNGQFVALREELDIVESYLAIERARFEERLSVSVDVPASVRSARIPPLLLQPLVENAVKHGIARTRDGGSVIVTARRDALSDGDAGFLRLQVIDTGGGVRIPVPLDRDGVGLANIEGRLRHYFGAAAAMSIHDTPGGGTTVEVCLPWIEAEPVLTKTA